MYGVRKGTSAPAMAFASIDQTAPVHGSSNTPGAPPGLCAVPRESSESTLNRWRRIRRDSLHEVNRAELDRILDKISSSGMSSLSAGDREFLERFAAREQLN